MSLRTADGSEFNVDRDQLASAADHDDPVVSLAMETLLKHRQEGE